METIGCGKKTKVVESFLASILYDELAPGGESLTGIVWCFPKIEVTLPVLEDTVIFRFAWGLFYSRDHEFGTNFDPKKV